MSKATTTITIDPDVKKKAKKLLASKGINLSFYIEQCLRSYLKKQEKEVE